MESKSVISSTSGFFYVVGYHNIWKFYEDSS
jgi:hypothetical protein